MSKKQGGGAMLKAFRQGDKAKDIRPTSHRPVLVLVGM